MGGRFLFAMRSSTAEGFELCPSDACHPMPSGQEGLQVPGTGLFSPSPIPTDDPLVRKYIELCLEEGIEIAGIEFVEDAQGRRYTYDVNGTTNYNQVLGAQLGIDGMVEVARYIRRLAVPGRGRRRVAC